MNDKNNEKVQKVEIIKDKKSLSDMINMWVQIISTGLSVFISIAALVIGGKVINNVNQLSQSQQQLQQQIQSQKQEQLQTQVVIEPRDGDIIVHVDDDYKLLQLIQIDDVIFPDKVQEIQIKPENSIMTDRVDILNVKQEDWITRDSFKYVISNFSINPNKVINLLGTIESLTVYCDFYEEKNISTLISMNMEDSYYFKIIDEKEDVNIRVSNINEKSNKEYVTKEANDGIEWVKIRVEIVYAITNNEKVTRITDTIISDWIPTDADIQ